MRREDKDDPSVKKLETRFALLEKRIRHILAENESLAARVEELERELARARNDASTAEEYRGRTTHIRRKVENILQSLESIAPKKED